MNHQYTLSQSPRQLEQSLQPYPISEPISESILFGSAMNPAGSTIAITGSTADAAPITTAAAGVTGTDLHVLLLIEGELPSTISDREEIAKKLENCNFTVRTAISVLEARSVIMNESLDDHPIDLIIVDNQEMLDFISSNIDLPAMVVRVSECVDKTPEPDAIEYSIMPIKEEQKVKLKEYALSGKRKYHDSSIEEHQEEEQDLELEQQQPPPKKQRASESLSIALKQLETDLLSDQGINDSSSSLDAIIDGSGFTVDFDINGWSFEELNNIIMPQEQQKHQPSEKKQKENQVPIEASKSYSIAMKQLEADLFSDQGINDSSSTLDGSFKVDFDINGWSFEKLNNIFMPQQQQEHGQESEQKMQNQVKTIDETLHVDTPSPKLDANILSESTNQLTNTLKWVNTFLPSDAGSNDEL